MKLPKTYEPSQYEPAIYALWETSGAFAPTGQGKPYSIIMPPPMPMEIYMLDTGI